MVDHREHHPTIASWISYIERLEQDAQSLVVWHHIYQEVKKIIIQSPVARQGSSFHRWLDTIYPEAACVKVRRLADKDRRTYSLKLLLEQIQHQSHIITRTRHRKAFETAYPTWDKRLTYRMADTSFDKLCGKKAKSLWPSMVRRDLVKIDKVVEPIKTFVDKEVAHLEKNWIPKPPTHGNLDNAIRCIEKLIIKYNLLLKFHSPQKLLPVWQYNWKRIFEGAWLPNEDSCLK